MRHEHEFRQSAVLLAPTSKTIIRTYRVQLGTLAWSQVHRLPELGFTQPANAYLRAVIPGFQVSVQGRVEHGNAPQRLGDAVAVGKE